MIDNLGGMPYVPGIDQTVINPYLGGIGFGIIGGFGIRLAFIKGVAIEPVFQVGGEKLNLSAYGKMRANYNFLIRLALGDKLFRKK